jgi:hypothetical protein
MHIYFPTINNQHDRFMEKKNLAVPFKTNSTRNPGRGVAAPTMICYSIAVYIFIKQNPNQRSGSCRQSALSSRANEAVPTKASSVIIVYPVWLTAHSGSPAVRPLFQH